MRSRRLLVATVAASLFPLALLSPPAAAQYQPPSEKLLMSGQTATTWSDGLTDVVALEGPVRIDLDQATLTARQAVLWISPNPARADTKRVQVALVGDARVKQGEALRSGERMMVTAEVAGKIQLRAEERFDRVARDTALYRLADSMRNPPPAAPAPPGPVAPPAPVAPAPQRPPAREPTLPAPSGPQTPPPFIPGAQDTGTSRPAGVRRPVTGPFAATRPATLPTTAPAEPYTGVAPPPVPVIIRSGELETVQTEEGQVAAVVTKGVTLLQRRPTGDLIELQSQRAVVYTSLNTMRNLQASEQMQSLENSVTGAYLEGDVRIVYTPARGPMGEQRLSADQVFYEFTTDRAVLTHAVLHTVQPRGQIPVTIRAKLMKQLAQGEFKGEKVQLSTSAFAVPSMAIAARKVYVRQDPGVGDDPDRTLFQGKDVSFRAFGAPLFYLPGVGGSMTSGQSAVRALSAGSTNDFGWHAGGEFGLFETLGQIPPRDLDVTYRADYYGDRGPGVGANARYKGGFITEMTREPWSFEGEVQSYFVNDHGEDNIGRPVQLRNEGEWRGQALYEHQHYFPDGWQLQLRAGYVSDQEFLEEWFSRSFDRDLPRDVSLYLKHQQDNESYSFLLQFQPNDLVTTSYLLQEQFEVEHLPELTYRRVGDSLLNDRVTFYTDNSFAGLHFQKTSASLAEQGFIFTLNPGIPSLGTTGITDQTVYRGDFRQEFDFPFQAGNFKVVPYLVGRYTAYSDSPVGGAKNRFFAGAGARITTAFWKTDDTVSSEMFDLHRLRHVIEPELNLFTSAQTVDRSDLFIYEERNDPINDISAAQIALRQRWQTYRGGPGRWRSVDFFTLGVEANLFANKPSRSQLNPVDFRGLYFPSLPETSIPRNSINANASWRISDNTVVLADASQNLDEMNLTTASIGLVVRRGEHLIYYIGNRYINNLSSSITSVALEYELTRKYALQFAQSFDFGLSENVSSELGIVRRFDSFYVVVKAYRNETTDENGFGFNIYPNGVGYGLNSGQFAGVLNTRRGQ